MYSNINLNNTERKEIGVPILRRTDEMISQFNLDFEKNFKINKYQNLDKEFKEFLRHQEQQEFYLNNLIKLLKIYFKENNYNSDTYYFKYLYPNKSFNKGRYKRTKSFILPKNKFKYYYILRSSINYVKHQPWIYPLGIKDKKNFIYKKLKTEFNINTKKGAIQIGQSVLKLYIDIFGQIPVNYIQKENNKKNKAQKRAKSSYNNNLKNVIYSSKGFDDKTHSLLIKGMKINKKYFGSFEKLKKYVYMKKRNALKLKTKSLSSQVNNSNSLFKQRNKSAHSIKINKRVILNNISAANQNQKITDIKYMNLKNFTAINKTNVFKHNNSNTNYYNNSSMNSISSINYKLKMNQSKLNNNNNIYFLESKNNNNTFKKNITQDDFLKFNSEFTKSIKKSKIFRKDISGLNRIFSNSKKSYNKAQKVFEKNRIKRLNMLYLVKDDIKKQKKKEVTYFKFSKKYRTKKLNFLSFVREPKNKLSFLKDFTKQRELRKYKYLDIDSDSYDDQKDERKNEFNDDLYKKNNKINKNKKEPINQKKKIFDKFKLKRGTFGN